MILVLNLYQELMLMPLSVFLSAPFETSFVLFHLIQLHFGKLCAAQVAVTISGVLQLRGCQELRDAATSQQQEQHASSSSNNACQLFCMAWGMHVALRETGSSGEKTGVRWLFQLSASQSGVLLPHLLFLLLMKCMQQNSIFSQCLIAFHYEKKPHLWPLFWLIILFSFGKTIITKGVNMWAQNRNSDTNNALPLFK